MSFAENVLANSRALLVNYYNFDSMQTHFCILLDKVLDEIKYESVTRVNDPELPIRVREGFLTGFLARLDRLYSVFLSQHPNYGDDREAFVARMRPIFDEYLQLREEFFINMIIN
jgi:hypothetical protein